MNSTGARAATRRYVRAPHLVSYWDDGQLAIENFAHRLRTGVVPAIVSILDLCATPLTVAQLARRLRMPARQLRPLITELVDRRLLREHGEADDAADAALDSWTGWNPAAGFFHTSTKDVPFESPEAGVAHFREKRKAIARPPIVKQVKGRTVRLPKPDTDGPFAQALLERRTWRDFDTTQVTLDQLSTLLNLTSGIQGWSEGEADGRVAFKPHPSGGARHPLETYVHAVNVDGLPPGLYHYACAKHRLVRVGDATRDDVKRFVPQQEWYMGASALVYFTAVVARTVWRYSYARAYRGLLLEAGHACQNFCLTATWLGLAPFCTAALGDTAVEQALGIDGLRETVLYAAGVGTRPVGESWVPWPNEFGRSLTPNPRW